MPGSISCDQSDFADPLAVIEMMERVQQYLAEITAPIVDLQLAIAKTVTEHIPERLLEFQKQFRKLAEIWNKYIQSCLGNIDKGIFKIPFYPVNDLESVKSIDTIDVNHSNSPPKGFSLGGQAIENFKSNIIEYSHSKVWKFIKREFPEIIRAVIHQLILNWLFH